MNSQTQRRQVEKLVSARSHWFTQQLCDVLINGNQ